MYSALIETIIMIETCIQGDPRLGPPCWVHPVYVGSKVSNYLELKGTLFRFYA